MDDDHKQNRSTFEAVHVNSKDCLSCRIMGTGLMAGTGSYAIWQSRAVAPGSPAQKKVVAGLGLVLLVGSVFRWRQWK